MLRENKGVTLVALVITIIVLLILAGVSISLVVGDNGVLTQSTTAADSTNKASVESALGVAISGAQTTWYAGYYATPQTITSDFATYLISDDGLKKNLSDDCSNLTYTDTWSSTSAGGTISGTVVYNSGKTYTFTLTLTTDAHGAKLSNVAES